MMSFYNYTKFDEDTLKELENIVGRQFVITDPEKIEPYSHDFIEIEEEGYISMPEADVKPETSGEIAEIIKLANVKKFPVTPRGAGSGLSGGAVPLYGGVVLSLERMNRMLKKNMMPLEIFAWITALRKCMLQIITRRRKDYGESGVTSVKH